MVVRGRRALRIVLIVLVAVVGLAIAAFLAWASTPAGPEEAEVALAVDTAGIELVDQDDALTLRPGDASASTGIVFYPGARVAPAAYVPTWAPIVAESGIEVVIPRMPLNLAALGRSRAESVLDGSLGDADGDGSVERWLVGGHSLGGAMAASWLGASDDERVVGLVLWASYPTDGAGLETRDELAVLSIGGSRDGLSTPDDLRERRGLLPADAELELIEGMNHAQFGRYGPQRGDLTPRIDDAEAAAELTRVVTDFLDRLEDHE